VPAVSWPSPSPTCAPAAAAANSPRALGRRAAADSGRPPTASRSLLLCCTPRCGSWLLADLLEQTGVAGRPHEWFWRETVSANKRAWRIEGDEEYRAAALAVGTTANGVFAAKVMWTAFEAWQPLSLPAPKFVWLRRDDEVAQARGTTDGRSRICSRRSVRTTSHGVRGSTRTA
jgi:hypothetical protein